jgi:flagellar biosynthesis protein FliP
MALSVVLSLVVMQPVLEQTGARLQETRLGEPGQLSFATARTAVEQVVQPWREFLLAHAEPRELAVFSELAASASRAPLGAADVVPTPTIAPTSAPAAAAAAAPTVAGVVPTQPSLATVLGAYVLSEVKRGFLMAFFLLLPFFVIDVVVANLLVSLGLTMLSPVVVTLPLKLLLFISSDGWLLLAQSLVRSYQ